jgi:hypothetical protein
VRLIICAYMYMYIYIYMWSPETVSKVVDYMGEHALRPRLCVRYRMLEFPPLRKYPVQIPATSVNYGICKLDMRGYIKL